MIIKLLKSGELSEKTIHQTVIQRLFSDPHLKRFTIHIPNEGKRSPYYGHLLRSYGMRKGAYDILLAIPNRGFHGAWIELKTVSGKLSKEQIEFGNDMRSQNYFAIAAYGLDNALDVINWYVSKGE